MPPKKRKAAAVTAEPASTTNTRAPRGKTIPEDTAAAARPRRGAAAVPPAPEPETRSVKKARGVKKHDAAEATAPSARRGRAPTKHKAGDHAEEDDVAADAQLNQDLDEAVEEAAVKKNKGGRPRKNAKTTTTAAVSAPEPKSEPPKRKGRPAKNAAPAIEEQPAEPPKKRGRGKAAAESIAPAPEVEKPAEAPPKRGRGKKQTTDTAPEPDPKTARGRRGKVTVDQQDAEPEQTVPEAPKTRGRPKKSATVPKEKTEDKPAKRGRGKATKTELEIEKVPVKRRRGRQESVAPEESVPKRVRTAAKPAEEKEEAPKGTRAQAAAKKVAKKTAEAKKAPSNRGKAAVKREPKKPAKEQTQHDTKPARSNAAPKKAATQTATTKKSVDTKPPAAKKSVANRKQAEPKSAAKTAATKVTAKPKGRGKSATKVEDVASSIAPKPSGQTSPEVRIPAKRNRVADEANAELPAAKRLNLGEEIAETAKKAYWLMKAEPESRLENGVDVKFSIDDLAARAEPEPWDGVRNHVAKKNMQAMQKGDLAFFYHSSCKEPGVVGIMEIVEGPQPDESAFDPNHPYYDPKSKRERPTWFCVKVAFRSKFTNPERVTLSKLKELKGQGGTPVDNIQLLTTTRLSVTRVLPHEWEYILGLAGEKEPKSMYGSTDGEEASVADGAASTNEAPDAGEGAAVPGAQDEDMVDATVLEQAATTASVSDLLTTNITSEAAPAEKSEHTAHVNWAEVQSMTLNQIVNDDAPSEAPANVGQPADAELQPEGRRHFIANKSASLSKVSESVSSGARGNISNSSMFPSSLAHSITADSPARIMTGHDELPPQGAGSDQEVAVASDEHMDSRYNIPPTSAPAQDQVPVQNDTESSYPDGYPITSSLQRIEDEIRANPEPVVEPEDDTQFAEENMGDETMRAGDYHTGFGSALEANQTTVVGDDTAADLQRELDNQTWHSISEDAGFE